MSSLSFEELQSRYDFVCRAGQSNSAMNTELQKELLALESLINKDLVALTKQGCPDNITDILTAFEHELTRFRQFCEFPALASKSIIGIGGGFSAGKSSFINKLIGKKCLAVEVDPTTSMPAYVLHGENESIKAINMYDCAIDLSAQEFSSLTHEEKEHYGSQVGLWLKAAFVSLPEFKWQNLAFLDTPGYSKPEDESFTERTDENLARDQLNTCDFILWVVQADNGIISEEDIKFLSSLDKKISKLIVVSKADKKTPEDVGNILSLVRTTLQNRGISVLDVLPFSRKGKLHSIEAIEAQLGQWNQQSKPLQFAQNFKRQFLAYEHFIEQELNQAHSSMDKLNKILILLDDEQTKSADLLLRTVKQQLEKTKNLSQQLASINQIFFQKLKQIGDMSNIPIPEPSALAVMDIKAVDLLSMIKTKNMDTNLDYFFNKIGCEPAKTEQLLRTYRSPNINFACSTPSISPQLLRINSKQGIPMQEVNALLKSLEQVIDNNAQPFASHIISQKLTEYEINQYATLLASFVSFEQGISAQQERLFKFYLPAISPNLKLATLVAEANNIDAEQVNQTFELLIEKKLQHYFLLDVLVFSRLNGEFSQEFKNALNACCHALDITEQNVDQILLVSDLILEIREITSVKQLDDSLIDFFHNPIWQEFISKQIKISEAEVNSKAKELALACGGLKNIKEIITGKKGTYAVTIYDANLCDDEKIDAICFDSAFLAENSIEIWDESIYSNSWNFTIGAAESREDGRNRRKLARELILELKKYAEKPVISINNLNALLAWYQEK